MKVIDKYWFTSSEGCVGIIITENHVGDRKARISRVQGNNEETDTEFVVENGAEIPIDLLKGMIRTLEKKT